jgi:outer membrane protein
MRSPIGEAIWILMTVLVFMTVGISQGQEIQEQSKGEVSPRTSAYDSLISPYEGHRQYEFTNDEDRQELTLQVTEAYFRAVLAEKLVGVAEESIRALEALRNQTTEFYKAGIVPKTDVLGTEGQLVTAEIERINAISDLERHRTTIRHLLGYPAEMPLRLVPDCKYRPNHLDIVTAYNIALTWHPDIRREKIALQETMIGAMDSGKTDSCQFLLNQQKGNLVKNEARPVCPKEVKALTLAEALTRKCDVRGDVYSSPHQLVRKVLHGVKIAYVEMKRWESQVAHNRKAVEFNRERFRINQERYKEQVATYIEVLDAQRQLSESQGRYYTSLIEYRINLARLEKAMGVIGSQKGIDVSP